ncbi:MAG: hypothetical protein N2C14_31530, partial [Planctomycetales bacterium]
LLLLFSLYGGSASEEPKLPDAEVTASAQNQDDRRADPSPKVAVIARVEPPVVIREDEKETPLLSFPNVAPKVAPPTTQANAAPDPK